EVEQSGVIPISYMPCPRRGCALCLPTTLRQHPSHAAQNTLTSLTPGSISVANAVRRFHFSVDCTAILRGLPLMECTYMNANRFCSNCGSPSDPSQRFCSNCGSAIDGTTGNPQPTELKPGSSAPDFSAISTQQE